LCKPLIFAFLFAAAAEPIREVSPFTAVWTTPCILASAMFIAWGAESAQFFIAQGFALAILAWLQTLPEFAVEAVLAWHQQVAYLMANLTGALRLLTGLGWPMIYASAALFHRRKTGRPLRKVELEAQHSVQVVGLAAALAYAAVIWAKGTLHPYDAVALIGIYGAYLMVLGKMPPQAEEGIDELELIPRTVVLSPRPRRIALIAMLFIAGGALIYFTAEPFLASLLALAAAAAIPNFVFIQWVAPFVSEFPEMMSTFYFARTVTGAPMALMNMVSSNINQWTLLMAMLPLVYSASRGISSVIPLDAHQELELLMTIGQALVGMLFLVNMVREWWEAAVLFVLWAVQFGFSAAGANIAIAGLNVHQLVTIVYFVWAAWEALRMSLGRRKAAAFIEFAGMWRKYVR
jgi:cation:H+ antiporter